VASPQYLEDRGHDRCRLLEREEVPGVGDDGDLRGVQPPAAGDSQARIPESTAASRSPRASATGEVGDAKPGEVRKLLAAQTRARRGLCLRPA